MVGRAMVLAVVMAGCRHQQAGEAGGAAANAGAAAGGATGERMTFSAEVVSVARDGSTMTLRELSDAGAGAREKYAIKVSPSAADDVKSLDPGQGVTVTCDEVTGGMGSGTSGGPAAPAEEEPAATGSDKGKDAARAAKGGGTATTGAASPEPKTATDGRYQGTGSGIGATMGPTAGAADSAGLESCARIASATPIKGR
jgi:hypothetical protein